jgi:uncharacterized membrane protein
MNNLREEIIILGFSSWSTASIALGQRQGKISWQQEAGLPGHGLIGLLLPSPSFHHFTIIPSSYESINGLTYSLVQRFPKADI